MENFLLDGEELVSQTPNNVVLLTTHRLRYNSSYDSRLVSIMLEKVSSCEVQHHSSPILLILGIIIALIGGIALTQHRQAQVGGLISMALGFIFMIIYAATRRHVISIASDGGARITFETKGLKREAVISFINKVEKAKHERMMTLSQYAYSIMA